MQPLNAISSVPGLITFSAPTTQKTNFLPRVGIAWAPTPKTSVNVGFAMANDVLYDNLGILSLPPQVQQTCDTQSPSQCLTTQLQLLAHQLPGQRRSAATAGSHHRSVGCTCSAPALTSPTRRCRTRRPGRPGIQHIFANKYTLEVRYVGTRGIHLPVQTRLNAQAPVSACSVPADVT